MQQQKRLNCALAIDGYCTDSREHVHAAQASFMVKQIVLYAVWFSSIALATEHTSHHALVVPSMTIDQLHLKNVVIKLHNHGFPFANPTKLPAALIHPSFYC